jgi:basic membrane protein A and related proteins
MSKKLYLVLAIVLVAAMLLPACSTGSSKPDCTKADVFCVGLVTDVGKIDDKSFNQSAYEGMKNAEKDLKLYTQYIETTDSKDYAKNIGTFADAKYKVIITVGFNLGEATIAAAKKYPDVKFIGIDQAQTDTIPNLTGLIFNEDVSGFLAGALAAQMTKTDKIGAVCGTDAVPPVWRYGEGYKAGAAYINPKVEVTVVYHSDVGFDKTFVDPEWGKTTALSMIDKGVDVIFGAGGKTGNGALQGAAQKGVYAIGVDDDQYYTVPEASKVMLSSAMKLIKPGVYDLVQLAKDGKFPGGNYYGQAAIAPYHDVDSKVPDTVKAKMTDITKQLADGTIKTGVSPAKPAQ